MHAIVTANNQQVEVPVPCTLKVFLEGCGLHAGAVVVEMNGSAVSPSEFSSIEIQDGDCFEIVHVVAGG
jgi:thiamine biosynthesis protein ThiS